MYTHVTVQFTRFFYAVFVGNYWFKLMMTGNLHSPKSEAVVKSNMFLKGYPLEAKTDALKLECAYFLGQTS